MDFDDPFDLDDPDNFGDPDAGFDGASFAADPAPGPGPSAHAARALVAGETGVAFDALVLFAEPLFGLYDLDIADAFAVRADPGHAPPEVLTVLETARLLWAFFSLPPAERAEQTDALTAQLVGPDATADDWTDIEAVLDKVAPHWEALSPEERQAAERTGHACLDFAALLAHPAWTLDPARAYGPDALSETEARALFAQPLLDDPGVLEDPDAFEHAMDRANAYWALAQAAPSQRDAALREAVAALANGRGDRATVEAEARLMVARFDQLFPEHARAA